jgi:hypothetical protein
MSWLTKNDPSLNALPPGHPKGSAKFTADSANKRERLRMLAMYERAEPVAWHDLCRNEQLSLHWAASKFLLGLTLDRFASPSDGGTFRRQFTAMVAVEVLPILCAVRQHNLRTITRSQTADICWQRVVWAGTISDASAKIISDGIL